jgi:hypothetical protein
MAGITERLALIIDADAKGAVKELQAVGKSASVELGKTDDALGKTKGKFLDIGVGALAFGATVAVGAKKAIDAAQDLADAQDKANATFSQTGVDAVTKFADTAADKFGLSKQKAIDMSSTFSEIGKSFQVPKDQLAEFGTTLTGLSADLAEKSGKSIEDVQQALQSAIQGKGKAVREFGIDLDAGVKGMDAFKQITEQTGDVTGFFQGQVDDAGQSAEIMKAKFENTKAALGEALVPVLSTATDIVGDLVGAFNNLPGPLQTAFVGAGIAAAGLKTIGVDLGDLTGIVGKSKDIWTKFGTDAEGGLTKAGGAAVALGSVIAAAGIIEAVGAISDAFQDVEVRGENAMNKIAIAVGQGNAGAALAGFREQVQVTEDSFDWTSTVDQITLGLGSATGAIDRFSLAGQGAVGYAEDFKTSFDNLFDSKGAAAAQVVVDALRDQNEALDHGSDNYKATNELLGQWQERIDLATGAQKANTDAVKAGAGGYDAYTSSVDASVDAMKEYTDAVKANFDPLFGVVDAQKKLKDAQADSTKKQWELVDAVKQHGPASLEAAAAQDAYNESQLAAVQAALGLNGSLADLEQKMADGTVSTEDAYAALDQWVASGMITKDQADKVKQAFKDATDAGDGFSKSYEAKVTADFSDFYTKLKAAKEASSKFVIGGKSGATSSGQRNADSYNAVGGVMAAGERSWVGENGPEIFQAGASGYIIPNNRVTSQAMRPQGGDGASITYEINVSVAPGSEADAGRALVDAIKAHERIAGPGWRQ